MQAERNAELVVCAAPLAGRAADIVAAVVADGWQLSVITSTNAASWIDGEAVASASGEPAVTRNRSAGEPRRRPRPSAVMVVPATFNTLNKLRQGISDTPALGVLNDTVGMRVPLLVVPMVSERLVGHPAWPETEDWLRSVGASLMDPATGQLGAIGPLSSGAGDEVAERFDPKLVTGWLREVS